MPSRQILAFLDQAKVQYQRLEHSQAYTALEVAESAHIRGHKLAKVVVLEIDNTLALLVIPASTRIDLEQLKHSIRAYSIELADSRRFQHRFNDCETGAIPPLGNLYGLDVYLAEALTHEADICFCAGTHTELIRMPYDQFAQLVDPIIIRFGAEPIHATPSRMHEHRGHNF